MERGQPLAHALQPTCWALVRYAELYRHGAVAPRDVELTLDLGHQVSPDLALARRIADPATVPNGCP